MNTAPFRRTAAFALAATIGLALAGCAGGSGTTPSAASDASTDATPRKIADQFGDVEITGTPERIVAAGNYESDIVLALGGTLVGQGEWSTGDFENGIPPWREALLDGADVPTIPYNPDGYDIEETLALDPDLVLNAWLLEDEWATLNEQVPALAPAYEASVREVIAIIGEALGKDEEATRLVADYDALLEDARAEFPELEGAEISVAWAQNGSTLMSYTEEGTLSFLTEFGVVPSPTAGALEPWSELGSEQFAQFDGDVLIVASSSADTLTELEANPLFQAIPAVADGRYLGLSDGLTFDLLRSGSPAQAEYALENALPQLAALLR